MKNKSNTSLSLRKMLLSALVAAPLATLPAPLWALPNTASTNVTSSSSTTSFLPTGGNVLTITDTTANRLVLKWVEFGSGTSTINSGESVIWTLPSSSAAVLNTVTGGTATTIAGNISSNGSLYILNSAGITLTGTATVSAKNFGISTVPEAEFFFLANGNLSYTGTATAAAVISGSAIDVTSSGSVYVVGKTADISGTINAGTLNITTQNGQLNLASAGALTIGTNGTSSVAGNGNLVVATGGGNVNVAAAGNTTVRGGTATFTTSGGNVTQTGSNLLIIGDTQSNSTLTLNTGSGSVTLGSGSTAGLTAPSGSDRVGINLTSGITQIVSGKRLQLNSGGTVTGNSTISTDALTVRTTGGSIDNGGEITVTGGQINLRTDANNSGITFKGPGDLTFSGLTTAATTGSAVTLTSTTGSIVLPAATIGGSLTVTAQNNITQTGALVVNGLNTRTGSFDALTGSVTLTNANNDFTNLVVKNAPGGASVSDVNDLTLAGGTSTAASLTIVAPNGVKLGNAAGDAITVGGDLNITSSTAAGLASLAITNGGSGYTAAPALTFSAGGGTASTSLTVTAIVQPTGAARGSGYTSVPTVTVSSGSATASTTVAVDTTVLTAGSGYTSAPTVTFSAAPSGGSTAQGSTTLAITTAVIANAGSGYTTAPTVTILGGGAGSATATIDTTTGAITGVTFTGATGYATAPSITFGAVAGASPAGQASTTGQVASIAIANAGTGYTTVPTIQFGTGAGGTGASATSLVRIDTVKLISGGSGYSVTPTLTFSASPGLSASVVSTTGSVSATSIGAIGSATSVAQPTVTPTSPGVGGTAAAITAFAGAGVSDASNNVTVLGKLNITTPGIVAINGNTDNGVGLNHRFGQVNINQGSGLGVTIYESTTLNLGNVNVGTGTLRAYSAAGDIINSDKIAATVVEVGAGTAVAPGNITLDNSANAISTRVSVIDDIALLSNTAAVGTTIGSQTVGNYLARNLTITNTTGTTIGLLNSTLNTGIGNLTVTATGAGNGITLSRTNLSSTGVVTLSAEGVISADNSDNVFGVATVTSKGTVNVASSVATTFNATLSQPSATALDATFRTLGSSSALTIGSVTSDYTGTIEFRSNANTTSALQDSVAGLKIFGNVFFNSSGSVTINRSGHNFGRVQVTAGNNRNAAIVESGTLKLGSVSLGGGSVSFSATSTSGDIIQDTGASGVKFSNSGSTATFTASQGNVLLEDTDNQVGGRINATALGNVTLTQNSDLALGNITAGGFLKVDLSNASSKNLTQASSSKLNVYDTVTFQTNNGNVTVGNTGNRLGGVVLSTGSGNIVLTEATTLNLRSVISTGTFAATSENGSIIDSASTAVTNNLLAGSTNGNTALGATTFTANNGNIALTLSSSNYGTVAFNTAGNVSIVDAKGNTTLTTSVIGGTLDVTNLATYAANTDGAINQTGAIKASGNTTFITNLGRVDLSNGSNEFGALRFVVGTPGAAIAENTTLNLRGGTSSSGTVQLSTNGNFITSGGASFFSSDLIISAQGTIIPTAGSLFITPAGTLTVFSPAAKDLSALSKSSNLSNKDPINLGSGSYSGPSQ